MPKPKYKEWVMPAWMEQYRGAINNTGGNTVEELMNEHNTTVQVNAPLAMICVAVKSQVSLLEELHKAGKIA